MTMFADLSNELITTILSFSTIEDLLFSLQLVNKQCREIIQTAPPILRKLTFLPSDEIPELRTNDMRAENGIASDQLQSSRNSLYDLYQINPLIHSLDLFQLFFAYSDEHDRDFSDCIRYWGRAWSRHLSSKTPWLADHSKRGRWLKKDATWRKFLARSHNQAVVRRLDVCSQAFNLLDDDCSNFRRRGYIEFGSQTGPPMDGMTFGDFYDLITIPELGLFRKGLKHSLAWKLVWGKTWKSGENEVYEDVPGRACVYFYHVSEDARGEEHQPTKPEDHGVKLSLQHQASVGNVAASDESDDQIEALAVRDYQDVIDSGRLKITWEDDYFTACTWDPEGHAIFTEMPSQYGPEYISPFVMRYSEEGRREWAPTKDLMADALRLCREKGLSVITEVANVTTTDDDTQE